MLGAIIGDIVGSTYEVKEVEALKNKQKVSYEERIKILDKNIPLFIDGSSVTDDSILTVAIADAILNNNDYNYYLNLYGNREVNLGNDEYGRSKFGNGFVNWLYDNSKNNSYGNGCAMRISPVGFYYEDINDVLEQTYLATIPSHNHEESIKSASAVTTAIYLAKNNYTKEEIKNYIENNYFKLDYNLEELQHNYTFTSRAINSVPQAIFCFLESNDFEDAIRKSISIGGDTDTIAAITGSISEAYYGIPEYLINESIPYLKDYMKEVVNKFYKKKNVKEKYYGRKIKKNY